MKRKLNYSLKVGKNKEFHLDRGKVFARLISAGTGAGKTKAGWFETWRWASQYPGSVGYVFEPNYKMIRRILLPTFQDLFGGPLHEIHPLIKEYSRTEGRFTWRNGSTTWFMGLDDPESAEGANIDYAWMDEFRLVGGSGPSGPSKRETAWRTILRRLRGSVPGRFPSGLWVTTTPGVPGSVLHSKFENPKTRMKNSKVYRWSIFDNPFLSDEYRAEIINSHSGGLAERFVYGKFANVAIGSFGFDYSVHVFDDMFPLPPMRQMVYGVDFGWSNPSCVLAIGLDGDGRAYVLEEFYQRRVSDDLLLQNARELRDNYGEGIFRCDRSEPKTIRFLRKKVDARADKSKRDDGIREIGGRFKVQGDDRPRIYIHEKCSNLISELQIYNVDKKEYDHAVDALRYGLGRKFKGEVSVDMGRRP